MNFNKLTGTVVILMLSSAAAFAADAHHDHQAPAPATDSHAADAKEAPASKAPGKDATAKDPASQPAEEPGKPALAKKSRKPARAKPQHKAPTHGTQADAHGGKDASTTDAHAPQSTNPAQANTGTIEGHGSKRLRVKNRTNAAAASLNVADSHSTSSAPAADAGHDAPAASAGHDGQQAPAAVDNHAAPAASAADNHAAPPAKDSHDDHAAPAAKQAPSAKDAHGSSDGHAVPVAAKHDVQASPAVPQAHAAADTHADSHAAPAKSTTAEPASDYCNPPLKSEVAALFDRWNASLRTGDPKKVVANYAPGSVLLPTVSNRARFTTAEKEDYFVHFLARRPEGSIDDRVIDVDCNSATDAGLYTFRFSDGTMVKARYSFSYRKIGSQWLITSHHSSAMPEKAEVAAEHGPAVAPNPKPAERAEQGSPVKGWVRYP
jgi:uncharacterized protein (TIGR02246 family)